MNEKLWIYIKVEEDENQTRRNGIGRRILFFGVLGGSGGDGGCGGAATSEGGAGNTRVKLEIGFS